MKFFAKKPPQKLRRFLFVWNLDCVNAQCLIGVIGIQRVFLRFTELEEFLGDLREECVGQHVLLLLQVLCDLEAKLLQLRLEIIRRTVCDRLLVTDDLLCKGAKRSLETTEFYPQLISVHRP